MDKESLILRDAITYLKITKNNNYKERLLEAYYLLKENNIKSYEQFENSNIGIGAFTYTEITLFDRIKNENYMSLLSAFNIEINGLENLPKDYGDVLASYGTVGNTPYRDKYIKEGFITTGLTGEEKNRFYK